MTVKNLFSIKKNDANKNPIKAQENNIELMPLYKINFGKCDQCKSQNVISAPLY